MEMLTELLEGCLTPVCIVFTIVFLGCCLGKIQIKGISLDLAGVLITAILFGVLVSVAPIPLYDETFNNAMKCLSSFGTALFVSTIGLSSGYSLATDRTKLLRFFLLGMGSVALNFLIVLCISVVDKETDPFLLYGTFCGAMTSTPGLAAVCEKAGSELAPVGYGGAYFFGVIGIVVFIQIMCRGIPQTENNERDRKSVNSIGKPAFHGILQISAVIVLGCLIGAIRIPGLDFTLGNSGGILSAGILLGMVITKTKSRRLVSHRVLSILRGLGLALFFVGSGIPSGVRLLTCISIKGIVYGVILTTIPIMFGYCVAMYLTHRKQENTLSAVCGIMTSTPAMGVLINKPNLQPNTAIYSITYTGALLTMVVCMRFV